MTDDQLLSFVERFVISCERAAAALEGLHETHRRHIDNLYPEPRPIREAVVTRVPNREDRIREAQGATGEPLDRWLSEVEQEEEESESVGVREREWLDAHGRERTGQGTEER